MIQALKTINDLYISMEQGNIGKLLIVLDDTVTVYTARCMGGNRRGREGILQQVPTFYRPGTGIKKTIDHFVELANRVIVLGNIQLAGPGNAVNPMPFADIWSFENDKISAVIFYYRDPQELFDYLEDHLDGWPGLFQA